MFKTHKIYAYAYAYTTYKSVVPLPVVSTVNLEKLCLNIRASRKWIGFQFSATPFMHLLTAMYEDWSAIRLILTRTVIGAACEKCNLKSITSDTKVTPIS